MSDLYKAISGLIGNKIEYFENLRTGEITADNGDGTYDVKIANANSAYPNVETLDYGMTFSIREIVVIGFEYGCKESPKILGSAKKIAQEPKIVEVDYSGGAAGEWVSPTGYIDPGGSRGWWVQSRAYDEDTTSSANYNVAPLSWSNFLRLTHAEMHCNKVRFWTSNIDGKVNKIDIDAYYDGGWYHVYEGSDYEHLAWTEKSLSDIKIITEFKFRLYNSSSLASWGSSLYEVDFFEVEQF